MVEVGSSRCTLSEAVQVEAPERVGDRSRALVLHKRVVPAHGVDADAQVRERFVVPLRREKHLRQTRGQHPPHKEEGALLAWRKSRRSLKPAGRKALSDCFLSLRFEKKSCTTTPVAATSRSISRRRCRDGLPCLM
ncbi:hypothetical protein M885DRAFT_247130 [Pelagophyceae sp. CCMP2097]|nr:hypothetical protein M885DRAFT_247130 [Pelagophyceae sp. CCMP2097]